MYGGHFSCLMCPCCARINVCRLAQYNVKPQTFQDYIQFVYSRSGTFKPSSRGHCKVILLQPIGKFDTRLVNGSSLPLPHTLDYLMNYCRAFFPGMIVELLDPISLEDEGSGQTSKVYWRDPANDSQRRPQIRSRSNERTL